MTTNRHKSHTALPIINKIAKKNKVFGFIWDRRHLIIDISVILFGVWCYTVWGIKGIFISVLIDVAIILILKWNVYLYAVRWGFKYIYGKYPYEFKKGEKLPKLKWVGFKKKNERKGFN